MAYYLVSAKPKKELMVELNDLLKNQAFIHLRPFGQSLTYSLNNARIREDGIAVWEEEDYCTPPLAMERQAVLDKYFENLSVQKVSQEQGWKQIQELPPLFPEVMKK